MRSVVHANSKKLDAATANVKAEYKGLSGIVSHIITILHCIALLMYGMIYRYSACVYERVYPSRYKGCTWICEATSTAITCTIQRVLHHLSLYCTCVTYACLWCMYHMYRLYVYSVMHHCGGLTRASCEWCVYFLSYFNPFSYCGKKKYSKK